MITCGHIKRLTAVVAGAGLVATLGLGLVGTAPVGAAPRVAVSPVGTYKARVLAGGTTIKSTLTVSSNGHFLFGNLMGSWKEVGKTVTLSSTKGGVTWTWVATQKGENLGGMKDQGTFDRDGTQIGTWYALRS